MTLGEYDLLFEMGEIENEAVECVPEVAVVNSKKGGPHRISSYIAY